MTATDKVYATYDYYSDTAANRPATPTGNRLSVFVATDTGDISVWTGSAWRVSMKPICATISLTGAAFNYTGAGSWQTVPLDTVDVDTAGGWNNATHAYTVPVAGNYLISGGADTNATLSGFTNQLVSIWKNGTGTGTQLLQSGGAVNTTGTVFIPVALPSRVVTLAAGDVLTLGVILQGTSPQASNFDVTTYLTITRVSP